VSSHEWLGGPAPTSLVLLGHPVSHSLSPRFQQAALDAAAKRVRYTARDVSPDALVETVRALRAAGIAGNVTVPHKEDVARLCDVLTPLARRAGAVNTFGVNASGALVGHNTDVEGARDAIRAVMDDTVPTSALVLGAGGSAAAVLLALESLGVARVHVSARSHERAEALIQRLALTHSARAVSAPTHDLEGALVINTTPLGLHANDPVPLDLAALPARCAVLDLVYRPGETAWVRDARALGHRAEDGLRMLVAQGAAAYAWWFGEVPDVTAMWRVLEPRSPEPTPA
jgi:shikimate dehydrogenase